MAMDGESRDVREEEAPIHGDVLEAVFSHVPLIDLVSPCFVSKAWKRTVSSCLRSFKTVKPWLIVYTLCTRSTYVTTAHAYDPRSHVWIEIKRPQIKYVSAVRSSHSTLLYVLSASKFSFSFDPLHLKWHHADSPRVWRTDPIVAVVGHLIVIAGGVCDFENDPLAVEIYDLETRTWATCQSMPIKLKDSAAATWLSVAVNDRKMFVTEKSSSIMYSFDPNTMNWEGPYDLRPDPCMFFSAIVFVGDRLILVGLIGDAENVKSVKMWEVNGEPFECREVGVMPTVMVEKLRGENSELASIGVSAAGDLVYIYKPSEPEEVVVWEFGGGEGRWRSVRNTIVNDGNRMGRFVFSCSEVRIDDLQKAFGLENWKFTVKSN
ncbi:hypothetical protein L1049_006986 [Liquidambar formosana]|uniref:F-box domain-containing protein n=1 Tax=Liquidambar formosana TaxID=63359 RepID=A0AAP0RI10_LIQFO